MPRTQTVDSGVSLRTNRKAARGRAFGRKLALTLLVVIGAASLRPSSGLMASAEQAPKQALEQTADAGKPSAGVALRPASAAAPDIPFTEFDSDSEQILFDLANQARSQAGLSALTLDAGLSRAARVHALAMLSARQLSHQFSGEPSLPQRLAGATRIQLEREGENVAFDYSAADGHRHLMLSPPHRANLLNANYNVIGLGVVRDGDRLYIVQDFGHALPTYSVAAVKDKTAAAVGLARRQANQPDLTRADSPAIDDAACSMAQADKLGTAAVQQLVQRYTVLTYTTLHPETLPAASADTLSSHNLRGFSVGVCYGHTETYPTGVYWVVLTLQ
jgi:uncharacterized protein YkwD